MRRMIKLFHQIYYDRWTFLLTPRRDSGTTLLFRTTHAFFGVYFCVRSFAFYIETPQGIKVFFFFTMTGKVFYDHYYWQKDSFLHPAGSLLQRLRFYILNMFIGWKNSLPEDCSTTIPTKQQENTLRLFFYDNSKTQGWNFMDYAIGVLLSWWWNKKSKVKLTYRDSQCSIKFKNLCCNHVKSVYDYILFGPM